MLANRARAVYTSRELASRNTSVAGSFASLGRGRRACSWWGDRYIDDSFFARFNDYVFERVTARDREVAVVFVFIEERRVWLIKVDAIRARL